MGTLGVNQAREAVQLILLEHFTRNRPNNFSHLLLIEQRPILNMLLDLMWTSGLAQIHRFIALQALVEVHLIPAGASSGLLIAWDLSPFQRLSQYYEERIYHAYRESLAAATKGRLQLVHSEDLPQLIGPLLWEERLPVERAADISACRRLTTDRMHADDEPDQAILGFSLSVSEAVTNSLKHASGGLFRLCRSNRGWHAVISDHGKGFNLALLPHIVLVRGFSTEGSYGLGFSVMLRCVDRLYLANSDRGATVVLQLLQSKSNQLGGAP